MHFYELTAKFSFLRIILAVATLLTYLIHIRTNSIITRKQIESGNEGSANVQSMRSRITYLARSVVIISVAILFVAEFLHSGLYVITLRLLEITPL